MISLSQIYINEQMLSNFVISAPISKVPVHILCFAPGFQAGVLIPVSPEPGSHPVFRLQANNLSGVWKYRSGVCDSAWNQDFQECLLEDTLLCASHCLMLALNVNSKQLPETIFPL